VESQSPGAWEDEPLPNSLQVIKDIDE